MRYRTNNPFVMQNTLYTQIMMQKQKQKMQIPRHKRQQQA